MSCEHCTDPNGEVCVPFYGLAPHYHAGSKILGSTVTAPAAEWPSNFKEDPDCPGMGIWWCTRCGEGDPDGDEVGAAPTHPGEGESNGR